MNKAGMILRYSKENIYSKFNFLQDFEKVPPEFDNVLVAKVDVASNDKFKTRFDISFAPPSKNALRFFAAGADITKPAM
jgi:hypothetical protein